MRGNRLKSSHILCLGTLGALMLSTNTVQAIDLLTALPILAQTAEVGRIDGFYMNPAKFFPALGLFLVWLPTVWWVDDDAFELGLEKQKMWTSFSALGGIVGLFVLLLFPQFIVGIVVMCFCYIVPNMSYVVHRNGQVGDVEKVMTPYHFGNVANSFFGMLGAKKKVFNRNKAANAEGVPVEFVGIDLNTRALDMFRVARAKEFELFVEVQGLVYDAISRRSTDIFLEPAQDQLQVRYRIDGMLVQAEPFDTETGPQIVDIIKTLCGMNVEENRKPQDGTFSAKVSNRTVEARVASAGTKVGEKVAIRLFDKAIMITKLEQLGLTSKEEEKVRAAVEKETGLILAVGPVGSGKTTTVYAMLRAMDPMLRDIKTLEEVIEQQLDSITAEEFNAKSGDTITNRLKSILRTDPQVVMLSDFKDDDLANVAIQAANTSRLMLSTLTGTDCIKAIMSLIDRGLSRDALSSALLLVTSQRLVRTLCEGCKEPYQPKPEFLKKYNLPDDTEAFYRPPTDPQAPICGECGGVGYMGRTGLFEVLEITDPIREIIANNPSDATLRAAAAEQRMTSITRNGLRLVLEGRTSIDELMRALK